jgi:hypothetical protein
MTSDTPERQKFMRQLILRQVLIGASLILLFGTFVWLTLTGSPVPNPDTGQTHLLTLRAVTRYLTNGQMWALKAEGALVVFAVLSNIVFTIQGRQRL